MMHYHVAMEWAHGLHIEKFYIERSKFELMNDIAHTIVDEEEKMRDARQKDSSLPLPTLTKVEIKIIQ